MKKSYIMLYEKLSNFDLRFFVPIKSKRIESPFAGMPQFFGGKNKKRESNINTIKRKLNKKRKNYLILKSNPTINLIYSNILIINKKKITFYFYISSDILYHSNDFPFIFSKNKELQTIQEFKLSNNKKESFYTICQKNKIALTNYFQKSETYKAFNLMLRALAF